MVATFDSATASYRAAMRDYERATAAYDASSKAFEHAAATYAEAERDYRLAAAMAVATAWGANVCSTKMTTASRSFSFRLLTSSTAARRR